MREIGLGLLGYGTVGQGVVDILTRHAGTIAERAGSPIALRHIIVRDAEKSRPPLPHGLQLELDPGLAVRDPNVDIVVELIGGFSAARDLILQAIDAGKHVVTANKEVMAACGEEILGRAAEKGVDVYFEAAVAGGIPVIHPLKESLAGNEIQVILGIVNGTTNYILTRMEDGADFEAALKEAQAKGFAEADPSADIEGRDAAAKMAILATLAFDSTVCAEDVFTEGITQLSVSDLRYADELGFAIKLIGLARAEEGQVEVRVHPTLIPKAHPLAAVKDNYNAIFLEGDAVGELMFFGQGAGSLPTASSVVGDIIDISRNLLAGGNGVIRASKPRRIPIRPMESVETRYYLRMEVADQPGVLAQIARVFGDHGVSLEKVLQTETVEAGAELIFVTHRSREGDVRESLERIEQLPVVGRLCSVIRAEAPGS